MKKNLFIAYMIDEATYSSELYTNQAFLELTKAKKAVSIVRSARGGYRVSRKVAR